MALLTIHSRLPISRWYVNCSTECRWFCSPSLLVRPSHIAPNRPVTEAYLLALSFADTRDFLNAAVSRAEYRESGSNACRKKFKYWKEDEKSVGPAPMNKFVHICPLILQASTRPRLGCHIRT